MRKFACLFTQEEGRMRRILKLGTMMTIVVMGVWVQGWVSGKACDGTAKCSKGDAN